MKKILLAFAASTVFATATAAWAQVSVSAPWMRATVARQTSAGAFLQLLSATPARLVAAQSPLAAGVEIHRMEMAGQVMTMREVGGVDLPAGKPVDFTSGGLHVMLVGLKRQLKDGDSVPLTLLVERPGHRREAFTVQVPVKPFTYTGPRG